MLYPAREDDGVRTGKASREDDRWNREGPDLPEIVWIGQHPRDWRLPSDSIGWGVAHRPRPGVGALVHIDWFAVTWRDHAEWRHWCVVDGVPLFVRPSLAVALADWGRVHAISRPGTFTVLRESMDMEIGFGCAW